MQQQHQDIMQAARVEGGESLHNSSMNKCRVMFSCACTKHFVILQPRSMVKAKSRDLQSGEAATQSESEQAWAGKYCRRCNLPAKPAGSPGTASTQERRFYLLAEGCFSQLIYVVEMHAELQEEVAHRFDVYVPELRLAIEIDGKGHFTKKGMRNARAAKCDAQVDAAVVKAKGMGLVKGLLRLHYADHSRGVWAPCITKALRWARDPSVSCFVMYSRSYKQEPVIRHM